MSKQFPNQYWDVYKPSADCKAEYQGKKLFADPDSAIPDNVLENFTLEEKGREFVFPEGAETAYRRMASNGYMISTVEA